MMFYLALFKASLKKNLIRYIVIVATIMITVSVAIASGSITDNAVEGRDKQFRSNTLNSQILVKSKKNEDGSVYFKYDYSLLNKLKSVDGISKIMVRTGGNSTDVANGEYINMVGVDIAEQNEVFPFKLIEGAIKDLSDDSIIINEKYASEWNYKVGSKIKCNFGEKEKEFTVLAICANEGIFSPGINTCVASRNVVEKLIEKDGYIYSMGLTLDNLEDITNTLIDVTKQLPDTLEAEQTYDLEHFKAYVGTIKIVLIVVSAVFVLVLSFNFFITVKLIVTEKKKQYSALNKMGIPVKALRKEMLFENVLIAFLSVILGDILSFFIIKVVYLILQVTALVEISISLMLITDAAVLLMVIIFSEWAFIKAFYLKEDTEKQRVRGFVTVLEILLYVICAFISVYLFNEAKLNIDRKMIYLILGFMLILLAAEGGAGKIFRLIFTFLHKHSRKSIFTIEMDINSKRFVNIFRILSLLGMAFFMSFSIRHMVEVEVGKLSQAADYVFVSYDDYGYEKEIRAIGTNTIVSKQKMVSYKLENSTIQIFGLDDYYIDNFSCESIKEGNPDLYEKLDDGKNVVISVAVSNTEGLKLGDKLDIGGSSYEITGIVTSFNNMGKVAYIDDKNFDEDLGKALCVSYLVKTDSDKNMMIDGFNNILYEHEDEDSYFNDARDTNARNSQNNTMTFNLANVLIIFCAIAGMIGISNNIYIETMARKKNISVKRLIGFKKKSIFMNFIKEAILNFFLSTIIGTILGVFAGIYLINILEDYIGNVTYSLKPIHFLLTAIITLVVSVISYSFSANRAVKTDALEEVNSSGI